jgi:hypothetical protein
MEDVAWKVEAGKTVKILYSTLPQLSDWHYSYAYGSDVFYNVTANTPLTVSTYDISDEWTDILGVTHDVYLDVAPVNVTIKAGGNWTVSDNATLGWEEEGDFKVFIGETHEGYVRDISPGATLDLKNAIVKFDANAFRKSISDSHNINVTWPLERETVHVDYLEHYVLAYVSIDFTTYPDKSNKTEVNWRYVVDTFWSESLGGRYEWTVVGRDSKPVDSIGASLVTAAFKNKQVEIGNAGLDMQYLEYDIQSVPNVMAKFGTGNAWADYYGGSKVTLLATSTPGTRSALVDDWCTQWPVAGSNMITVGGPKVNVLTDYLNDFAEAYYGTWDFGTNTGYGYYGKGAINALSCWSKNYYYSTNETGYAVISTYKDLNGTVIFSIWGVWGRDTFYAAKWFYEGGIYEMQGFPSGVTSIILKIDYTDPKHPIVEPVEMLGTISELILHPDP